LGQQKNEVRSVDVNSLRVQGHFHVGQLDIHVLLGLFLFFLSAFSVSLSISPNTHSHRKLVFSLCLSLSFTYIPPTVKTIGLAVSERIVISVFCEIMEGRARFAILETTRRLRSLAALKSCQSVVFGRGNTCGVWTSSQRQSFVRLNLGHFKDVTICDSFHFHHQHEFYILYALRKAATCRQFGSNMVRDLLIF
jgi:hypothetical protein